MYSILRCWCWFWRILHWGMNTAGPNSKGVYAQTGLHVIADWAARNNIAFNISKRVIDTIYAVNQKRRPCPSLGMTFTHGWRRTTVSTRITQNKQGRFVTKRIFKPAFLCVFPVVKDAARYDCCADWFLITSHKTPIILSNSSRGAFAVQATARGCSARLQGSAIN